MLGPRPPYLSLSRPALELLGALPVKDHTFSFAEVARIVRRPRTTLVRLLAELVAARLLLRTHRDRYLRPASEVSRWLMTETDAYLRSVYLFHSAYQVSGRKKYAFACLPVKSYLDFEIPQALPVFPADPKELRSARGVPNPEALRYSYSGDSVRLEDPKKLFSGGMSPPPGGQLLPCLNPLVSLALMAATADPRLVRASSAAAPGLGVEVRTMIDLARSLHPERPPVRAVRPNTVVYPRWLAEFSLTAAQLHSRRSLARPRAKRTRG